MFLRDNFISYYQIASRKVALVKKDSETEQNCRPSSPEKSRMKTFLSSPSLPSWKSVVEMSVNRTNSSEDVRNPPEVRIVLKINVQIKLNLITKSVILKVIPYHIIVAGRGS